jgi:hypothetical protein
MAQQKKAKRGAAKPGRAGATSALDKMIMKIKRESKSESEALARIKKVVAQDRALHGNRPQARLVGALGAGQIRVGRIEVLLPSGFDPSDLPPHGGDPADNNVGDYDPPWDADRQDPSDTNGL